jgi:tRNA A-37 threonylcarbamoyl transferase component Bud32
VSPQELERTLKDLPRLGTLVKDRGYRQVWRFEIAGKGYYLKFFPRPGSRLKRALRGSPAMREFTRLQWLQKAKIPSPRAVAVLAGFMLNNVKGDAVLSEAVEPATQLDRYLNDFEIKGERAPDQRRLSQQLRELVNAVGKAGFGHDDLHLGNVLRHADPDKGLFLLDAYDITEGGLKMDQILRLGHSVARYATRQDILRGWRLLADQSPLPRTNRKSPAIWKDFTDKIQGDNRYFGSIELGEWTGAFFKHWKYPYRHSPASRLHIDEKDWQREWPDLLAKMEGGVLETIKSSPSGDVFAAEITLAGRPVEVIVKRPRRRSWFRHVREFGRGSRAKRAWKKSFALITRNIPSAWPLLFIQRKVLGYAVDQVIVFERVPGKPLALTDLDSLGPDQRDNLFRRAGRILRRIDDVGFSHFDSKSSNWIVMPDEKRGPTPVLVDVDGVRFYPWSTFGVRRLLRSMRDHKQYTPADSLALCQGYAPFTRMELEEKLREPEEVEGARHA